MHDRRYSVYYNYHWVSVDDQYSILEPQLHSLSGHCITVRSAASPRLLVFNPATPRRPPAKSASPTPITNAESHEPLSAFLKLETDQKEQV